MHGAAGRGERDDVAGGRGGAEASAAAAASEAAAGAPRLSMPSVASSRLRGIARSRLRRPIASKGSSKP